jgi:hypothetical protein
MRGDPILMDRTPEFEEQFTKRLDALSDQWKSVLFRAANYYGASLADCRPLSVARWVMNNAQCYMSIDSALVSKIISNLYDGAICERCNSSGWIDATKDAEFLKTYKPAPFGTNHFARAQEGTPSFVECPDCDNFFGRSEPDHVGRR